MPEENSNGPAKKIDLHSHLLPGLDDGCISVEESLECVRQMIAHGYQGTVCTPHIIQHMFPNNVPKKIQHEAANLRTLLAENDLDYKLWTGGEIRIQEDTIEWLNRVGVPTLGESRYVLFDYFGSSWPREGDKFCDYLLSNDYQPLLAHPERMAIESKQWLAVLDDLCERGVKLQGNLNCLTGREGDRARQLATDLLNQDRYWVLAMDMHRPDGLWTRFEGLHIAEQLIGEDKLHELLVTRPHQILGE